MSQEKNSTNVHFASRLQRLLEEKGMTKAQLADLVGVSPTAIGNYCNGRIPRSDELCRISAIFGVSMETLLTGQEGPRGDGSAGVWKMKAEVAEQKLKAIKAAMRSWLEKI